MLLLTCSSIKNATHDFRAAVAEILNAECPQFGSFVKMLTQNVLTPALLRQVEFVKNCPSSLLVSVSVYHLAQALQRACRFCNVDVSRQPANTLTLPSSHLLQIRDVRLLLAMHDPTAAITSIYRYIYHQMEASIRGYEFPSGEFGEVHM